MVKGRVFVSIFWDTDSDPDAVADVMRAVKGELLNCYDLERMSMEAGYGAVPEDMHCVTLCFSPELEPDRAEA